MRYNGAEITIKLLEKYGIHTISGMPGGANLPLYDALGKSKIKHILIRHEQGAGFIAQGMARSTGEIAVCFATSGPGALNLITAIADANMDSIPIIAITGQVINTLIGTDAFQEVDTCSISKPIVKKTFFAKSAKDILKIIPEAFRIAKEGRPGPVLIDIPKDVQLECIDFDKLPAIEEKKSNYNVDSLIFDKTSDMINSSKKPIILIGGGVIHSGANKIIKKIAKKNSIPIATTLMGLGAIKSNDSYNFGMLGMHGAAYTNRIIDNADLMIAIGVRFSDRSTGNIKEFCKHALIIHIDIDSSEIDKNIKTDLSIIGDAKIIMEKIELRIKHGKRELWFKEINQIKKESSNNYAIKKEFHPLQIVDKIGHVACNDTIITTDVGQHQMWVAQKYPFSKPRQFLTSAGLGTMGFGLPAAIGAAIMNPEKTIICFTGDGSILMNVQELATLKELDLNIKIILLNNGNLGMVRQQQEFFYRKKYIGSQFEFKTDYVQIARGFGLKSFQLNDYKNLMEILKDIINEKGSCLIDIEIDTNVNVYPTVKPGKSNIEMIEA